MRVCGERADAGGREADHGFVAAVGGVEVPLGWFGQLEVVVGLGKEVVDNECFAGRDGDAEVAAAGGMLIVVELLKLVVAGESGVGYEAGWGLIGGNLELRIVGGRVWVAGVMWAVGLGDKRNGTEQGGEESARHRGKHGSFYPADDLNAVASNGRRSDWGRSEGVEIEVRGVPPFFVLG